MLTSQKNQEITENGWKSAGIIDPILFETKGLPSLDPFSSVEPHDEGMKDFTVITTADTDAENFVTSKESYVSDSENESGDRMMKVRTLRKDIEISLKSWMTKMICKW